MLPALAASVLTANGPPTRGDGEPESEGDGVGVALSESVDVGEYEQSWPPGHVHTPLEHTAFGGHTLPHVPQFCNNNTAHGDLTLHPKS